MFPDNPIKKSSEDLLNRGPLAGRIAQMILAKDPEHPLVMALQGPWGTGKSSVFGLVERELKGEAIVLWYEPWFYNNQAQMISGYLDVVASALAKAGKKKRYKKRTKELLGKYGSLLTSIPYVPDVSALSGVSPESLRDEIGKLAREMRTRVVVLVDDVDRLPADEMLLVLKLVRLCSNFPYFTYLLAFDKKVVKKALAPAFEGDSDFIEKIVQIEVPLPPVDEITLRTFVGEHLASLCEDGGREPKKQLEEFLKLESGAALRSIGFFELREREPLFLSLREAKRYLNAVETTLPLVRRDVHLYDFFALEYVRVFAPDAYEQVYRLRYTLASTDSVVGDHRRHERHAALKELAERIESEEPRSKVGLKLLFEVFPIFDAAVNRPNYVYGHNQLPAWARDLRARHPAFVDRYFQLEIPADAVSRGEVRELLGAVVKAPGDVEKLLDDAIQTYRADGRLLGLLEAIEMERGALPSELREQVAELLVARSDSLADAIEGVSMFDTKEIPKLCHTVFRLLDGSSVDTQQQVLMRMVKMVPKVGVGAYLYYMTRPDHQYDAPLPGLDADALHGAVAERFRAEYVAEEGDIFADYPVDWPFLLHLWNSPDDATVVVLRLLRQTPSRWVSLANVVTSKDFRRQRALVLKGIEQFTRIREVASAARELEMEAVPAGDRPLVERVVNLLRLVPDLVAELAEIEAVASRIAGASVGHSVVATWTTPVWDRWNATLKGWWSGKPWWGQLERLYRQWQEMHELAVSLATPSGGPGDGAETIDAHDQLVQAAADVRDSAHVLQTCVDEEIEHLPELPIDPEHNRDDD